jgi:hypothetical protein
MQPILVDGGELVPQTLVEIFNDLCVALHDALSLPWPLRNGPWLARNDDHDPKLRLEHDPRANAFAFVARENRLPLFRITLQRTIGQSASGVAI